MTFYNKFKPNTNNAPAGVNLQHSSFGYHENQKPYTNPQFIKPTVNTQKARPQGGWDDDDDEVPQLRGGNNAYKGNPTAPQSGKPSNIKSPASSTSNNSNELGLGPTSRRIDSTTAYQILQCDQQFVIQHEYENNMINELIQPGGARLKQPDNMLGNFCKACESFQVPVVCSLLISKLFEEIPYVSKARLLFLIEVVVKKLKKYSDYFKYNLNVLKDIDFSNEGSNAVQLSKILEDIIYYIEEPNKAKQNITPKTITNNSTIHASVTPNILDNEDLLGISQPKGKQDPFAFIKKQPSDPLPKTQANNDFDILGLHSDPHLISTQPQPKPVASQNQPFSQTQTQTQPKKFNPFELNGSTSNTTQNAKPSSGPSINFKKFQNANTTATSNQNNMAAPLQDNKPSTSHNLLNSQNNVQKNSSDLNDLLGGLDFSGNKAEAQLPAKQNGFPLQSNISTNSNGTTNKPTSFNTPNMPASSPGFGLGNNSNIPGSSMQGQFSKNNTPMPNQFTPSYGSSGPYGAFPSMSGGFPSYGPTPYNNHPPGSRPQGYNYYPTGPNYGYNQPPYGTQSFGGNAYSGQAGMYGGASYSGNSNMNNNVSYSGQTDVFSSFGLSGPEITFDPEEANKKKQKEAMEKKFDSLKF